MFVIGNSIQRFCDFKFHISLETTPGVSGPKEHHRYNEQHATGPAKPR